MPRHELITLRSHQASQPWTERVRESLRNLWRGPLTSRSPELARYFTDGGRSTAGVHVSEASALNFSAVWAATRLIADDVASLPLITYRSKPDGTRERATKHPLYRLLRRQPNPEMSAMRFRQTLQAHVLLWGNAYAEIERDVMDRPIALWPLTPDRVAPFRDAAGRLLYRVANANAPESILEPRDVLHIAGLGFDGMTGYSVVGKARESIGLGLATERFGSTFFGNGATFGGVISFKGARPPEMSENGYKESLEARHQGVDRAHKLLALYNDATYTSVGVPPEDAQFLQTRSFQTTEIARWFKVPPHKIGDLSRATFSNIESQDTDYFRMSLRPWLVAWEEEIALKLLMPGEEETIFVEHLAEALLRGDVQSRGDFYSKLYHLKALTPNEIRARENLNPLPGGDVVFSGNSADPINPDPQREPR